MRIAQVAPLYESVPPRLYGGTERIVSYLTEALVRAGHEVTLFASGDSATSAALVSVWDRALRLDKRKAEPAAAHLAMIEQVFARAEAFDVIHFHTDYLHLPLAVRCGTASLTTLHGRLDIPGLDLLFDAYSEHPLVSISSSQRRPLPAANWLSTVYHGLPLELHGATEAKGEYLAFLGRVCSEKGIRQAIDIARRTGIPLKIAAKVGRRDREYFASEVQPRIDGSLVEFVGEITEREKTDFLGRAIALLFPIAWPEPFGLAMIEAMACGTPVIALRRGSVPEIIDEGLTGFIAKDLEGAADSVGAAERLDRRLCRAQFERRFSASRMAQEYVQAYEALIQRDARSASRSCASPRSA